MVLAIGIPIIVFGTYGTYNGGSTSGETIYLQFAFPAAVAVILILLMMDLARRPKIAMYPFNALEFQCLAIIFLLIYISTLRLPQYIISVGITSFAAVLGIIFVANHIRDEDGFRSMFRSYQILIYITSVLAVLSGAYSFHIGSFSVGPLLIEYNIAYWRVNSWYVTSTGMGLFFCQGLYAAYYLWSGTKSITMKVLNALTCLGFIYGMTLTGGRTGFIVLILSSFVLWISRSKPNLTTVLKVLFACGCLWLLSSLIISSFADEIYLLRRFQEGDTSTLGGRSDFMQRALGDIGKFTTLQFLFGVGVNGVQETLNWEISAHSGMLRFLMEYGILMVATYLVMSGTALLNAFRLVRTSPEFKAESSIILISLTTYFLAEFMVIQLFGVSIEFLMYIAVFAFAIVLGRIAIQRRTGDTGLK
jgi:hypothetical protein